MKDVPYEVPMATDIYLEAISALRGDVGELLKRIAAQAAPVGTGGLYALTKPANRDVSPWVNRPMTSPDVSEALERARHGVTWAGTTPLSDERWAEVWEEIERLKAGDAAAIQPYVWLMPDFVGPALLTDVIRSPRHDDPLSTDGDARRRGFGGVTWQAYIEGIRALTGRTGGPGIG